jgi:thiamine pyrophosphokinase
MPGTVLVFGGGDELAAVHAARLPAADLIVAADSGVDRARAVGLEVDVAIGDFDSVTAAGLVSVERSGARLVRHPMSKNETDLELAMLEAIAFEPEHIVVVAIDGGRIDHFLANVALLSDRRFAAVRIDAVMAAGELTVVHDERTITGRVGEVLSLLPVGGDAHGVRTRGLVYPLRGERLTVGSPRGVSNLFASASAAISVESGTVLAIRPFPSPTEPAR